MKPKPVKPRRKKRATPILDMLPIASGPVYPTVGDLISDTLQNSEVESKEVTVEFPTDWWQSVKQRFFPMWAKRKWPVQLERHTYMQSTLKMKGTFSERNPVSTQ